MTPTEIRAEIARHMLRRYKIAAEAGLHPTRLGLMLNGRLPMPEAVAARVGAAIKKLTVQKRP